MYIDQFFDAVDAVFRSIRETQRPAIEKAAEVIADSLAQGGALAVMDTGHMLRHEALCRAGGLMTIAPFAYRLEVDNDMPQRRREPSPEHTAELERRTVHAALDASNLRRGDVLVINSNSGRTANVIETALQCKERGIATIAICSSAQMRQCDAVHESGKKLFDAADVCIDNCGPHGDALIEIKDNERACPGSGLAATYAWWAVQAHAIELLQARGLNPTIYRSVHVSGHKYIDKQRDQFLEQGL